MAYTGLQELVRLINDAMDELPESERELLFSFNLRLATYLRDREEEMEDGRGWTKEAPLHEDLCDRVASSILLAGVPDVPEYEAFISNIVDIHFRPLAEIIEKLYNERIGH